MLEGLFLAVLAGIIFLLRERYPRGMTIAIRVFLGLVFAVLIGIVIFMLIHGVE